MLLAQDKIAASELLTPNKSRTATQKELGYINSGDMWLIS
jgi:hypothetical protein